MPSSFALGRSLERLVERLVTSGRYNSKSEVIRDALRLLERRESERAAKLDEIRRAFRDGIESGPPLPANATFDRLERRYARSRRAKTAA